MDISLVDYVRLTYGHTYTAEADALRFTAQPYQPVTIDGFSRGDIRLVDVTDPSAPRELLGTIRAQGGRFRISAVPQGSGTRTLLAFTGATIEAPDRVQANTPSSWSSTANNADYVIVSHADFLGALAPLKALREGEGHHVALIDVQDLYDEFSFGDETPQAIKDFMLRAHAAWHTPPRFLLLVGNATQDPRDYLGMGYTNYMPVQLVDTSLLEVPSDDWYADSDGDGQPDLALFAAISLIVGVIGNVLFLRLLSYYMQPWYFLCLMAVIAAGADAAQRAVPMGQGFRVLGVALTAVALISILFGPLYKRSTTRRTTIDEVARMVEQSATNADYIVLTDWTHGVTFSRYYHGSTPWQTLPPLPADAHDIHRSDLVFDLMKRGDAIGPVLDSITQTLREGHRVFYIGHLRDPLPSEHPRVFLMKRAEAGQALAPVDVWRYELNYTLQELATHVTRIPINLEQPISIYEDPGLFVLEGWRPSELQRTAF